VTSLYIST